VLVRLPRASQAGFNNSEHDDEPLCLPETRVGVLKEIKAWTYGRDKTSIFWLNGVAGTGKSTIARTICHHFHKKGQLGASFFFSRGKTDRSHAGLFFTTLAWYLAHSRSPGVKKAIVDAVRNRPDIGELSRREQWTSLVLQPLEHQRGGIVVIVIDALDECDKENEVFGLVALLVQAANVKQCRLRIVVTSRPEAALRMCFNAKAILHRPLKLHDEKDVPGDIVDGDICLYLYDQLNLVKEKRMFTNQTWPDVDSVDQLVQRSNRLFIYAATVCKFVSRYTAHTPDKAVRYFLSLDVQGNDEGRTAVTAQLDSLYRTILEYAIQTTDDIDSRNKRPDPALCKSLKEILGYITVLRDPLSLSSLAQLTNLEEYEISHRLYHTHSVLRISDDFDIPVELYHPSFRDFLHDRERCGPNFWIDTIAAHRVLAKMSLGVMSDRLGLMRNVLAKQSPGTLRAEVSTEEIAENISPALAYACRQWVQHLMDGGEILEDGDEVHLFLQAHFLHWIETLSWLGQTSESIPQIEMLVSCAEVRNTNFCLVSLDRCCTDKRRNHHQRLY